MVFIYRDASNNSNGDQVVVAVNIPKLKISIKARIMDQLSVYTWEMMAILIAVQSIKHIKI